MLPLAALALVASVSAGNSSAPGPVVFPGSVPVFYQGLCALSSPLLF
jgi:hypothetical protein